jgi:GTP-binding protein
MAMTFTLTPEPEDEAREAGRLLFAGPVTFVKGVVAMSGLPPADRLEVCFAGRSNVGKVQPDQRADRPQDAGPRLEHAGPDARDQLLRPGRGPLSGRPARLWLCRGAGGHRAKWQALLKQYLSGRVTLRRAFVLIDARHGVKAVDEEILTLLDRSR